MATPSRAPAIAVGAAGLIAVGAALGAGHLVAGLLLAPNPSPFLAVGNAAIDRTPAAVKDFAIEQFGTNDKLALLVGMSVVLALTGLVIGLVSRRSRWPGVAAIAALGAVGIAAVAEQAGGADSWWVPSGPPWARPSRAWPASRWVAGSTSRPRAARSGR